MALPDIPLPGDNALTNGFLAKQYGEDVIKRVNLFGKMRVVVPPGYAQCKFTVTPENVILDLSQFRSLTETYRPLQIVNASDADFGKIGRAHV